MIQLLNLESDLYVNQVSIDVVRKYSQDKSTVTLKSGQVIVVSLSIDKLVTLLKAYGIEALTPPDEEDPLPPIEPSE